jgi:hypothetical protein
MRLVAVACCAALALAAARPAAGQDREAKKPDSDVVPMAGFVARGGLVGVVEGDVTLERGGAGRVPAPKDPLEAGDVLRSGDRGRAEILLNPGYYLRLSGGAEAALVDLSPSNLKVALSRGSAVVEISLVSIAHPWAFYPAEREKEVYELVTVLTPQGPFVLAEGGLYRIDVGADGASALTVAKGLGDAGGRMVEPGTRATVRGDAVAVAKVEPGDGDGLDRWSLERSDALVRFNKSLEDASWHRQMQKNPRSHFEIDDAAWVAQARERATVSAASGLVTFAEGGVTVLGADAAWARPDAGDRLRSGDRVRTDGASRAEIQLYPNCRLYLSGGTEVAYVERPDKAIAVSVARGSVSVVSALDQALVTFVAPGAEYGLARAGVYRLYVAPDGASELLVHEGRVRCARGEVGGGKRIASRGGSQTVESVGKRSRDGFDVWSAQRAASSESTAWPISLLRKYRAAYGGMWFFDETSGAYTFVPGTWEYRSAYGRRYETSFRAWGAYGPQPAF